MSHVAYTPVASVAPFLMSEDLVDLICGPVGSTKTTAGIIKIAYHAKRMAPCRDGVRRSRCVWVRNTREQLRDTSIPDFLKWFPDGVAGAYAKTDNKFILKFDDVECEVLWRAMEDATDVRKLLSLQVSFAVFEEFREINPDVFEAMQGRLGRYPDGMMVPHRPEWGVDGKGNPIQGCVTDEGKSNRHQWGMSNPPDMDTYFEKLLSEPPDNTQVFIQPSGLSAEADWTHLLPPDYYPELAKGKSQEYIDVYIHAKFGKSLSGQPVFRSFDAGVHVAQKPLIVLPSTVIIGVDAGLSPAATFGQVDYSGRVIVHDSLSGSAEGMGALRFIRERIKPLLAVKYPGRSVIVVIDPAAFQRAQTDERTVAEIFKAEGFKVVPARTNSIAARLSAVDQYLTRTVNGSAAIVLDRAGCAPLITALRGKYRYKISTKGEIDDKPEKSHPWSDLADSLQYLCLHADGGSIVGANVGTGRREVRRVASGGWT